MWAVSVSHSIVNLSDLLALLQEHAGLILPRTMFLEVERKFCSLGIDIIAANAGNPPFRPLVFKGVKKFCDIYYDQGELLRSAGVYLRRRDSTWEAKIRVVGNFVNASFDEVTCESRIAEVVQQLLGLNICDSRAMLSDLQIIRRSRLCAIAG